MQVTAPSLKPHTPATDAEREPVLRALSAAAFLIFFQAYMIAPLIPKLSRTLGVTEQISGLLVPAYVLPYGFATLFYGPLSDRLGRRRVLLTLLVAAVPITALTATATGAWQLMLWRVAAGVGMGGIIPLTLALIGDLYPFEQRGRPLGWIFGAIAGGMAFGSTVAALVEPYVGWRGIFLIVAAMAAVVVGLVLPHAPLLTFGQHARKVERHPVLHGYAALLGTPRGRRAYGFMFLNGAFHSGVFSWLGLYFDHVYHLSERGIGLALLGYGVPGLLLGPTIGRAVDRWGRRWIITGGLLLSGIVTTAMCAPAAPLAVAAVAVTVLSLGYDMTHPPLSGIITTLDPNRRGQAMGLSAFVLFTGFGSGSLAFGAILRFGFAAALGVFAAVITIAGVVAPMLFRIEAEDGNA